MDGHELGGVCNPNCAGKECGDGGCSSQPSVCGSCGGGEHCETGNCVPSSTNCPADKDCTGLECGPDPFCGESCGTCSLKEMCDGGECVDKTLEPTWYDQSSGLEWETQSSGDDLDWDEAQQHCADLVLAGHSDWRVPTIGELRSLVRGCPGTEIGGSCKILEGQCVTNPTCLNDACKGCSGFLGPGPIGTYWPDEMGVPGPGEHWSSTLVQTDIPLGDAAWSVDFMSGKVGNGLCFLCGGQVRCARSL